MAKTKISEFDVNPDNNTDINNINIAEGCAPSGINNAIRQLMSDLKEQQTGASGDSFTVGGNLAVTGTSAFTGATTFTGAVVFSSTVSGLTNITLDTPTINSPTIVYEGATANDFETTLAAADPTADRTITFPDKTGTVAMTSDLPSASALYTSSGTYAISGSTTLTVNSTSHGRSVNDVVYLKFTSGTASDGYFTVTDVTTNTFTVTYGSSITTSGNVTGYYSNLGLISIASTDETLAGTSTNRAVAPAGVIAAIRDSLVLETAQATTSGTFIDFTDIPSWVKRITVMFRGVSVNSTGELLIKLGTSGGVVSSGYVSTASTQQGSTDSNTTGFISYCAGAAADSISGQMIINLIDSNTWVESFMVRGSTTGVRYGAGDVALGGTLTQVRITTTTGTDTFDAGQINIMYE
jgi:hypothetical protein